MGDEFGPKGINVGVLGWKLDGFPRGNPKTGLPLLVQLAWRAGACHDKFLSDSGNTHVFGVPGNWGSIRTFLNDFFDVFDDCFHF